MDDWLFSGLKAHFLAMITSQNHLLSLSKERDRNVPVIRWLCLHKENCTIFNQTNNAQTMMHAKYHTCEFFGNSFPFHAIVKKSYFGSNIDPLWCVALQQYHLSWVNILRLSDITFQKVFQPCILWNVDLIRYFRNSFHIRKQCDVRPRFRRCGHKMLALVYECDLIRPFCSLVFKGKRVGRINKNKKLDFINN